MMAHLFMQSGCSGPLLGVAFPEPRSADIPVRGFTGLSSPVFPIRLATRTPDLATRKSPEPADWIVRATPPFLAPLRHSEIGAAFHEPLFVGARCPRFMVPLRDFDIVAASHEPPFPERGRLRPRVSATWVRADEGVRAPADGRFRAGVEDRKEPGTAREGVHLDRAGKAAIARVRLRGFPP